MAALSFSLLQEHAIIMSYSGVCIITSSTMFIHSIIRFSVEGHDHQTSEALVGMTRCRDPG
ncbi:hypothetical protein CY34DRAFT_369586 [Suillus luteus UH-Slu-Lm8-n1]|uniref:Unplaced genomic scaffold CY34scaffold_24, whole genome shotgun sequence n=1 Tax=Suillus luteus UH-Slu-Lm8-n1 TaxID=930992 RepID=A0A0D0AYI3_9AGAM|nr:hypothetical protein CY34DRAFT_369586 [Suillus luteus UH-Slu-Lm8-n1]